MPEHDQAIAKLAELIEGIKYAMLITVAEDGRLRSRPMVTENIKFDGNIWFFTRSDAPKVSEIQKDARVNLSYAEPGKNRYISISGHAELTQDREKAKELWGKLDRAWFPDGLDDPKLALIRVSVEKAEYWDQPSAKMVQLGGFLRSVVTGKPPHPGENTKLDLTG